MNDSDQFFNQNYVNEIKYSSKSSFKDYFNKYKKYILIVAIFLIILIVFLVINSINKSKINNECNNLEKKILSSVDIYIQNSKKLPTIDGKSIVVSINDLINNKLLNSSIVMVKNKQCDGTVTITKVKKDYIKTIDLNNCSYCDTNKRYNDYGKEVEKLPNNKNIIVKPVLYYNYYTGKTYNSEWSNWFDSSSISNKKSDYGNFLPKDENKLPNVPSDAKIIAIERQTKNFYSYRDKSWKFYRVKNNAYSNFYSEKPKGYSKKDTETEINTPFTKWSIDCPDTKSYRDIESATGYQWYYEENNKKTYWNSGEYSVDSPGNKYNRKDKSTTMYRYSDSKWRWYNGKKREYSYYMNQADNFYPYKDKGIYQYTNWSYWDSKSYVDESNKLYREQKTDLHSRYRIKYQLNSFMKFDNYLPLNEFEKQTKKSIDKFINTKNIYIDIKYTYVYRTLK